MNEAEARRLKIVIEAQNATQQAFQSVAGDVRRLRATVEGATSSLFTWTYRQATLFGRLLVGPFEGAVQLIRGMFIRLAAVASVFFAGAEIKNILGDAAYLEQQRLLIESLTGSVLEAGRTIRWAVAEAAKTPFEVPDVIDATTQIISVGQSAQKWFPLVSTLAMMSGRGMQEGMRMATRAVVRLGSGVKGEAMELLRLLKISTADWRKTGIEISKNNEVMGTTEDRMNALATIIRTKFGDVYERMQNSATVAFSNVRDLVTRLRYSIAGISLEGDVKPGGFLDEVRKSALELIDWFNKNEAAITRFGGKIGQKLADIVEWLRENISTVKEWVVTFKDAVGNIVVGYAELVSSLPFVEANIQTVGDALRFLVTTIKTVSEWWREHARTIGHVLIALGALSILGKVAGWLIGAAGKALEFATAIMLGTTNIQAFVRAWQAFEITNESSRMVVLVRAMRDWLTLIPASRTSTALADMWGPPAIAATQRVSVLRGIVIKLGAAVRAVAAAWAPITVGVAFIAALITWYNLTNEIKKNYMKINELQNPTDRPGRTQTTLNTPWKEGERDRKEAYLREMRARVSEAEKAESEIAAITKRGYKVAIDAQGKFLRDRDGNIRKTNRMGTVLGQNVLSSKEAADVARRNVESAQQAYDQVQEELNARDMSTKYATPTGSASVLRAEIADANDAYESLQALEKAHTDLGKTVESWSTQNMQALRDLAASYDDFLAKGQAALRIMNENSAGYDALVKQLDEVSKKRQSINSDMGRAEVELAIRDMKRYEREQKGIARLYQAWSRENIGALNMLRDRWQGVSDTIARVLASMTEGTKDYEKTLDDLYNAEAKIMEIEDSIRDATIDNLVKPLEKAAKEAQLVNAYLGDVLQALNRGPQTAAALSNMAEKFGDPGLLAGQYKEEENALRAHLDRMYVIMGNTAPGSPAFAAAYDASLGDMGSLVDVLDKQSNLKLNLIDAKLKTAQARTSALEQTPAKSAARAAMIEQIRLETEKLAILREQLKAYEKQGRAIPAEAIKAQIADVTGSIFRMQKQLRENLTSEFDTMAQKIINAPSNLTQILARTGLAMMKQRAESDLAKYGPQNPSWAMGLQSGAENQTSVDVKVYIGQEQLDALIETSVQNAVSQHYPGLLRHALTP